MQVSSDGKTFTTVATLDKGAAKVVLKDNRVQAVRLRAAADQSEPLVVRAINLRLMVEVSGVVRNPGAVIGEGNVAVTKGDTEFAYPIGACAFPVINRGFTLKLNNGGNAVQLQRADLRHRAGWRFTPAARTRRSCSTARPPTRMQGTWSIKAGRVVLAKEPGVDAMGGTIVVGGTASTTRSSGTAATRSTTPPTFNCSAPTKAGRRLNLNGFSDTIARLTLAPGPRCLTDGPRAAAC